LVEEEIGGLNSEPSPASGTTKGQLLDEYDVNKDASMPKVCWLLEPLQTSAFTHYTGTLKHPNLYGKLGSSIHAFVHYAYETSSKDLVFTNIQGWLCCYDCVTMLIIVV
jgi:hypothetical protein